MAETKPIQIFLCHASGDKAAVLDIYDRLKGLGYAECCGAARSATTPGS